MTAAELSGAGTASRALAERLAGRVFLGCAILSAATAAAVVGVLVLETVLFIGQVRKMLGKALDAIVNRDVGMAREVIGEDQRVDDLRRSPFRIIISYMLEQPRYISPGLEMILVVQNLERIGDLTTNIAEDVVFLVEGRSIKHTKGGI